MSAPVPLIELDACRPVLVDRDKPVTEADDREADGWHS
jgi:hypothetical protein